MKKVQSSSLEALDNLMSGLSNLQDSLSYSAQTHVQEAIGQLLLAKIDERDHQWYEKQRADSIGRHGEIEYTAEEAEH